MSPSSSRCRGDRNLKSEPQSLKAEKCFLADEPSGKAMPSYFALQFPPINGAVF